MPSITYDQFLEVDIRAGRIVRAETFPKARKPAYRLHIDFGELGVKTSSAQITSYSVRSRALNIAGWALVLRRDSQERRRAKPVRNNARKQARPHGRLEGVASRRASRRIY